MHQSNPQNEPSSTKLDFSGPSGGGKVRRNPPGDRAVKLRLLSLLGLLVLVIVAMKEAGKPERWMWLGLDASNDQEVVSDSEIDGQAILLEDPGLDLQRDGDSQLFSDDDLNKGGLGFMPDRIADRLNPPQGIEADSTQTADGIRIDPQLSPVAIDFWRAAFVRLGTPEKNAFYQLLRRIDGSKVVASQFELPFESAITQLRQWHQEHQTKTLGQLAVMSQGDPKTKLTDQFFAFDKSWKDNVLPTLNASASGEDFTIADQSAIRSVKSTIDPIVMQNVQDLTGMANVEDKLAWLATWDCVLTDPVGTRFDQKVPRISLLQLKGQPDAFRGQRIAIAGNALTVRRKILSQTLLNVDQYYEIWVAPDDTVSDGLICVYAAELPSGFSENGISVTEQFESIEVPVRVTGRFFKIRSYQDAGRSVSHCPVVIAPTVDANFKPQQASAAGSWRPSAAMWTVFLIGSMMAAIGIAYTVFRNTQLGSTSVGSASRASGRLNRAWQTLAEDDSIMSDAQRVGQFLGSVDDDAIDDALSDISDEEAS